MASGFDDILREIRALAIQARIKSYGDDIALAGLDYAKKISPVETGHFRDAWSARYFPPRHDGDLPMWQLRNDDEGAVSVEYGTFDTPAHHTGISTRTYMQHLAAEEKHE